MLSPEMTMAVSLGGAALVAALPKLLEYIMGERIAQKKRDFEAEDAYRKAVFEDATASRMDRVAFQSMLVNRIKELEENLQQAREEGGSGDGKREKEKG